MVLHVTLPPTMALCQLWEVQAGITHPRALAPTMRTTVFATDIIGFGDCYRDVAAQLYIRHIHYQLIMDAFEVTGLPWWDCYRQDLGDGTLIVAPPGIDPDRFLDPLIHRLDASLRRYAGRADELAQLRLRLAVHHGDIYHDAHGVTGHALNHLFRLLDAPAFKMAVASRAARLGAIVSDQLYNEAMRRGSLIDPAAYGPLELTHKETRTRAWLWSPDPGH